MKALCWRSKNDVRVESVPDPKIINDRDAIIRVTASAICGSDLHIYNGIVPMMESGDVLGHEFMGEVVEVGSGNKKLKVGDKVVVPFTIACGNCHFCKNDLYSSCDRSNPAAVIASQQLGHSPCAMFGYSHMLGGYAGGQSEYVRVPFSNIGPIIIPQGVEDEKVLFLSDIFPTGYMAAEHCDIKQGDTVAVWGCGPVGQFAIKSAWMLGAGRVIAIDCVSERLQLAETYGGAEIINFEQEDVYERLQAMTLGKGPNHCIDAVGGEAHVGPCVDSYIDKAKQALHLTDGRAHVLREAIRCCRKGGTISVPGVYLGNLNEIPFGALMNKGLKLRTGQTHMQHYLKPLLEKVLDDEIDLSQIITHRIKLNDAPEAYKNFNDKSQSCIKVVMTP